MRTAWLILFVVLGTALILLGVLIFFVFDDKPYVTTQQSLSHQDIQRAKLILTGQLSNNTASLRTLQLTEKDLEFAANHLLNMQVKSATDIDLNEASLDVSISIAAGPAPLPNYLNIKFNLSKENGRPMFKNLFLGNMSVPDNNANFIIDTLITNSQLQNYYNLAKQHIKHIDIAADKLTITYQSTPESISKIRSLLTHNVEDKALLVYQKKLIEVIANHDRGWRLSLAQLLQPLFSLAYQRSTTSTAITENRNVLFIVSSYVNKREIQRFFPQLLPTLPSQQLPVYIYKREDMAKHFIGSAALTASAGGFATDLIGLEKEIKDAKKGGSGFSFIDLAADRAGMYFGEMATSSPKNARQIQQEMAKIKDYTAFMPDFRDLPEKIEGEDLRKQFQSIDSPAAQKILQQIDSRIAASPIYRNL